MIIQKDGLRYASFLLATLLISFSQFLSAQNLNESTAYVPTSWINRPISMINDTSGNTLSTILLRGSNGTRFACGFYCNFNGSECVFGVLIFRNRLNPDRTSRLLLQFPQLVWSANRDNPVRANATFQLSQDGDLVLKDPDGALVWSSNTRGKSISGLNLTETGNLVLFGRKNETIWQSFDHPTDSLLIGQKLIPGQKLIASVSASNWSQGLFTLAIGGPDSFAAYLNTNPPQIYYTSGLYENPFVQFDNGSFNMWQIPLASAAQFMRFEPDGHLKVYQWGGMNWIEVADLLETGGGNCWYPMVCGKYGVCSNGQQCGCPETGSEQASFFRQINFRQPNLGCSLATPISCSNSKYHSLLELKTTNYFTFFHSRIYDDRINLEDCKKMCLSNCSCKAALVLYRWDSKTRGGCVLLNEVFSIFNNEQGFGGNTSLFVKVQNAPVEKPTRNTTVILASSLAAVAAVLFIIASCLVFFRKKFSVWKEDEEDFLEGVPGMPTRYSYENLKEMTEDFGKKLGEGGFGSVYEGKLDNGSKTAVKCLDGLGHIKDSFLVEVKTIGSIHHVNLVKLIGFCYEKSHRLLVYEYMANGSLDAWIFGGKVDIPLQWKTRRKIILEIAKGLAYLHEDCSQKIIHFDIKPQNILLDQNFNAKVADFGLSKLIEKDQSRIFTTMRGTPGYLAPEWLSSVITEKVDVYSFGIVVLEILCGRKNLDWSRVEEDRHLLSLFEKKAEEEKLWEMIDENSEDMQIHRDEALEMMKIAAWCLQSDFNKRPSMSLVVKVLEGLVAAETNLNFDFTNPSVFRNVAAQDQNQQVANASSLILPSALSGPR